MHEEPAQLLGRRLPRLLVEVADHDGRALGDEPARGREADAARAARDDGDLAGESLGEVHVLPFSIAKK